MPNRSRPGRIPGTRELVLLNLPFLLPYRVQNNCIQVLRVFHMARQPSASGDTNKKAYFIAEVGFFVFW